MTSVLSSIEAEYSDIVERKAWYVLFQEIRDKCEKEAKTKVFTVNESSKSENRSLNRYRDVNPYDHSRIIIHRGKIDYINANLVKLDRADRKYILTQGPLKETVGHFWLMVWEQNTKAILMLNKLIEKKQVKCHIYWPESIGEKHILTLADVGLTVEYLKCEEYTHFSKRIFRLTDTESKKCREIIQFHYTTWPDFGTPSSPLTFLQFLKQVRDSGALELDVGPAVVHCSAGIGRSGTFCLVDCCLVLYKKGENKLSIREILYELRRYRMGLIQTPDQLYFSYKAIIEGIKLLDDPTFMDYEEIPVIPINEKSPYCEQTLEDNHQPPPLPPTRLESLKTAPPIPQVQSNVDDETISTTEQHKNEKNNSNTATQYSADRNSMNGRPLPPLPPRPNKLKDVKESDSDGGCDDDDDDDDEEVSPLYEEDSDIDENDDYENDKINEKSVYNENDIENDNDDENDDKMLIITKESNRMNVKTINDNSNDEHKTKEQQKISKILLNGIEKSSQEGSNLRRRIGTHAERQANIEKKVNEIKRKQREIEAETDASKKRRRRQNDSI